MTAASIPAANVQRTVLGNSAAEHLCRQLRTGTAATITAATRTRQHVALAARSGADFRLLQQSGGGWTRSTGPARLLAGELVGMACELEALADVPHTVDAMPRANGFPPLAPGELLALTEVARCGDAARIDAACDDLGIAELPWWVMGFAWGAEASLSFVLQVRGRPSFAALLHLLPSGWGTIAQDANDDLIFRPMTGLEVQARLCAFAALLLRSHHDNGD